MAAPPVPSDIPGRFSGSLRGCLTELDPAPYVAQANLPDTGKEDANVPPLWQRCDKALRDLEAQRRALQSDFRSWLDQLDVAQKEWHTMQKQLLAVSDLNGSAVQVETPLKRPARSQLRANSRHRIQEMEKSVSICLPNKAEEPVLTDTNLALGSDPKGVDRQQSPKSSRMGWLETSGVSVDISSSSRIAPEPIMKRVTSERSHIGSDTTVSSNPQAWMAGGSSALCVKVKVISARGLPKVSGWFGLDTCDPYCQCEIVGKPGTMFKTRAIKNVLDPVWNHEGFFYDFHPGDALSFTVIDKDQLTNDDVIGHVTLDSNAILPAGFEGELDLLDSGSRKKGTLKLRVSFVKRATSEVVDMRKKSYGLKKDTRSMENSGGLFRLIKLLGIPLTREERNAWRDRLHVAEATQWWQVVHGARFQTATSLVILVHVCMIGIQADAALRAKVAGESVDAFWDVQGLVFGIWFALELCIRAWSEGQFFIHGPDWRWNFFDFVMLAITFMDVVARAALPNHVKTLRSLRLARLIRIFRLVKVMRAFQSLRLLVSSISGSMVSLLWCFIVLVFIIFMFGIFFLHGVTESLSGNGDQLSEPLEEMYGSLLDTMVTLFQTISGGIDWRDAMNPLGGLDWYYEPLFLAYVFFMFFGVLNVVIGAFVATTADISAKDRQAVVQYEMQRFLDYREKIHDFFLEADKDHSGMLSWDEFEAHLQADEVKAYFQALELDVSQAHIVFKLLDEDGSDQVGLEEFFDGCMRLKGSARSIDVNLILYENQKYLTKFNDFAQSVTASLTSLEERVANRSLEAAYTPDSA